MPAPEFVVVGSGIAGLRAAIELSPGLRPGAVVVLTKAGLDDSATAYAQGGIAAALAPDDSLELHEQDTLAAGGGLCDPAAVRVLVREAPAAIEELLAWGAAFDAPAGAAAASAAALAFTREGAHSRSRVLHAHGDSTGREIALTLLRRARALPQIEFRPRCIALALLRDDHGRVGGVECRELDTGATTGLAARAVLLATGGLGQVYAATTNPAVATGDGVALAARAGAWLADMEFVRFHPTALALPGAPHFLLSEALRGEGAVLRNAAGERFLPRYDARAELAPRDVVSRAIEFEIARQDAPHCYLDATHLDPRELERRFPRILATLRGFGLQLATDLIPIRPAAHYAMGGAWTDLDGCSSVPGLYAAGEAACTGVHGANRLASNSLLEGLIFGARAARAMRAAPPVDSSRLEPVVVPPSPSWDRAALQAGMSRAAGVLRSGPQLRAWREALRRPSASAAGSGGPLEPIETANLVTVAEAIVAAALAREESRGAHYRSDFPDSREDWAGVHSFQRDGSVYLAPAPPA